MMNKFTSTGNNVNKASDESLSLNMKDSGRASDESLGSRKALDQHSLSYKGKDLPKDKGNYSINKSSSHEEKIYSERASDEPWISGKALDQQSLSYKGKELPKDNGNDGFNKSSSHGEKIYSEHVSDEPLGSGKALDQRTLSYKGKELTKDKGNDGFNKSSSQEEKILNKEPAKRGSGSPRSDHHKYQAALRLQKVYRSFRTRRQLADCAVIVEQKWWKVLDLAELKRSSISFFDIDRHGSALSKWSRAKSKAAKVGKGLSKDEKARKLALQHWLEAIDPRHRYGHNLQFYYVKWLHCDSSQPFFYWLDIGEGRDVDLERCSRQKLQQQCIKYLGPNEREDYEVELVNGKFMYKKSRAVLDTTGKPNGTKWIFVLSACRKLYVAQKVKGTFQHSSFLAGGATLSAGRLVLEDGFLKAIWPHSGHYLPTEENFQAFMAFLMEQNVDLTHVQKAPMEDDEDNNYKKNMRQLTHMVLNKLRREPSKSWVIKDEKQTDIKPDSKGEHQEQREEDEKSAQLPEIKVSTKKNTLDERHVEELEQDTPDLDYKSDGTSSGYETAEDSLLAEMDFIHSKMNMFSDDEEEEFKDAVPQEMIMKRISTHRRTKSYQLAEQLSFNWTTGAGPRIGCLRDYPSMLQFQAMEHVNLSPRGVKCMNSPGSASLGIKRDVFKVKNPLGLVPEMPKLGSVREFHSPNSSGLNEESFWE